MNESFFSALIFILPAYIANASAVVFHGKKPIDFNKTFIDKKRVFGANKTIEGFIGGFLCGLLMTIIECLILNCKNFNFFLLGALISLGALLGDLLGAFIKRRLTLAPGFPLPFLDQLDFVYGALIISYPFSKLDLNALFFIFLFT
ncbi:MAG: CDP-2,3-bis-(O-geranylgeranyl)-sn-glycerol synthase, partial [Candidatus Bathyarchaeia archaeon]